MLVHFNIAKEFGDGAGHAVVKPPSGPPTHKCKYIIFYKENYMYTIEHVAWYCVVTLRDSCLEHHLESLRKYYPDIPVYTIDNNAGHYDIKPIAERYNSTVLSNSSVLPLTINQTEWSKELFKSHPVLCFSADDVHIFEGGFIEKSLELINKDAEIVSFSTDGDPVAYMYTERYFNDVGFNIGMPGKERTDVDLRERVNKAYGVFPYVGEYWQPTEDCWRSRYVGNPHVGKFGKDDVNQKLDQMNIKWL